jgi:16S rRNA (adenine1518-N6/adenine1519-N6)-dimethyltransferase
MAHIPRKRFGQNFLHDPLVIRRILDAIGAAPGDHLVEIGPGQGAITRGLLQASGRLTAIELDRDLVEPLRTSCEGLGALRVISADALQFDFASLVSGDERLRLVGNLPYNISTPILFHLLGFAGRIRDMHFMLQKEVVGRMAAGPGGKDYGRLSVMLQAQCRVEPLFQVGPGAFRPAPKVDSAVVRLIPLPAPPVIIADPQGFAALVAQAFSQRRKTLRKSLQGWLGADDLEALGIDPMERPEQLSLAQFAALANAACKTGSPPRYKGGSRQSGSER